MSIIQNKTKRDVSKNFNQEQTFHSELRICLDSGTQRASRDILSKKEKLFLFINVGLQLLL